MKTRIFVSAYVGLCAYLLLTLVWGRAGMLAYRGIEGYAEELQANLAHLDEVGAGLYGSIRELQSSRERIVLEARRLQFFRPGDRIVRIEGYNGRAEVSSPGRILTRPRTASAPDSMLRGIAACLACLVFLVTGLKRSQS